MRRLKICVSGAKIKHKQCGSRAEEWLSDAVGDDLQVQSKDMLGREKRVQQSHETNPGDKTRSPMSAYPGLCEKLLPQSMTRIGDRRLQCTRSFQENMKVDASGRDLKQYVDIKAKVRHR